VSSCRLTPISALLFGLLWSACGAHEVVLPVGCSAGAGFAVTVTVVDSVTGAQPANVIVVVRQGEFVDSAGPQVRPVDVVFGDLTIGAGVGRHGRFDVSVRAPGYRDWAASADVAPQTCSGVITQRLTARLQAADGS
jgi:hypothetical protein